MSEIAKAAGISREALYKAIRPDANPRTSNTSSIPAERIFGQLKRPERTSITHFFAPATRSLPVEVVRWEKESKETIDYLMWFFAQTGKVPVITDNVICFMLDRVFNNWCNDAAYLLSHATSVQKESGLAHRAGYPPFHRKSGHRKEGLMVSARSHSAPDRPRKGITAARPARLSGTASISKKFWEPVRINQPFFPACAST